MEFRVVMAIWRIESSFKPGRELEIKLTFSTNLLSMLICRGVKCR